MPCTRFNVEAALLLKEASGAGRCSCDMQGLGRDSLKLIAPSLTANNHFVLPSEKPWQNLCSLSVQFPPDINNVT